MIGVPELLVILVIVLVVFGPGKLPSIGEAFGKSLRNFKRASEGRDEVLVAPEGQTGSAATHPELTEASAVDEPVAAAPEPVPVEHEQG